MRRFLTIAAFVVALLLALWWVLDPRRGMSVAPTKNARAVEVAPTAAELLATPEGAAPVAEAPREVSGGAAPLSVVFAPSIEDGLGPGGLRLRCELRSSISGRPLPGATLSFAQGQVHATVVTDAAGRGETEPILASGIVRARHVADAAGGRYPQRCELEPALLLVPEARDGERVHEVELVLLEPEFLLRVQVLSQGAPASAQVVCWRDRPAIGSTHETDVSGRTELAFSSMAPRTRITVWAQGQGLWSESATLSYPWPDELLVLELRPVGTIRVHTRDEEGRDLSGRHVFVDGGGASGFTDAHGNMVLERVIAGTACVGVAGCDQQQTVIVTTGGPAEVEFVLPVCALAAAGRVVDEKGEGLQGVAIDCQAPGLSSSTHTLLDGSFEVRESGVVGTLVRVLAGGSVEDERFDPEERVVPLGTTGLGFVRREPLAAVEIALAVVDARTREPLDEAVVVFYRARWPEHYSVCQTRDGLLTWELRPHEDVRILGQAVGYRSRELGWGALAPEFRAGHPWILALEPGFEQPVRTLEWKTHAPVAGARIFAADQLAAITDADGRARVVLDSWPPTLRVEANGYESEEWESRALLAEPEPTLWMNRGQ